MAYLEVMILFQFCFPTSDTLSWLSTPLAVALGCLLLEALLLAGPGGLVGGLPRMVTCFPVAFLPRSFLSAISLYTDFNWFV